MSLIADTLISHLPFRRRQTPSGWISFNAACCSDQRNRGGVIQDGQAISYHCFNCGFKASWQPGRNISVKMRRLFKLLNIDDATISKLHLEAIRHLSEGVPTKSIVSPTFIPKSLPRGAEPIISYLNDLPEKLIPVLEYLYSRNLTIDDYNFYWTPEEGFDDRLIIPFYYKGITVGYTARRINNGSTKYLSEQQPGYVFNLDSQNHSRKFVIVCEGPIDAISIDGISVLGSEISQQQILLIKQLQRQVIIVPDRDQAGTKLIQCAIDNNFAVSLPEWNNGVKDINDSVVKCGKINTLLKIKNSIIESELKIKLKLKDWMND